MLLCFGLNKNTEKPVVRFSSRGKPIVCKSAWMDNKMRGCYNQRIPLGRSASPRQRVEARLPSGMGTI